MHWSYVFLALTHWFDVDKIAMIVYPCPNPDAGLANLC